MAALVIKHLPAELHERLKREAKLNRRSMTQEALIILEHGPAQTRIQPIRQVEPFRGRFPLTENFVNEAKKWGRK